MTKTKVLAISIFLLCAVLFPARSFAALPSADLTGDQCVNRSDLDVVLGNFGKSGTGDVNSDGVVNQKDTALVSKQWGGTCVVTGLPVKLAFQGSWNTGDPVVDFIAQNYDLVITKKGPSGITDMRNRATAAGRDPFILRYYKFAGEHSPATSSQEGVSYWSAYSAVAWPGLHSNTAASGNLPTFIHAENDWYYANLTVPANRDLIAGLLTNTTYSDSLASIRNQYTNIDGFFFDNAGALFGSDLFERADSGSRILQSSGDYDFAWPAGFDPSNQKAYWEGKLDLLNKLKTAASLRNPYLVTNSFYNKEDFDTVIPGHNRLDHFSAGADAIMREAMTWGDAGGGTWSPVSQPRADISIATANQAPADKSLVLYSYGLTTDKQARIYALATSLLVSHGNVFHYFGDGFHDNVPYYYPEYDAIKELGKPTGDYTQANGLYVRDYEHGRVVVNTSTTATKTYNATGYSKLDQNQLVGNGIWNAARSYAWASAGSSESIQAPGGLILKR